MRSKVSLYLIGIGFFVMGWTSTLTGCAVVVAGAAAESSVIAMDRRTSGAQLQDREIQWRATSEHVPEMKRDDVHVNVNSHNRRVLLTGEVPNETIRRSIEMQIARMVNVDHVDNETVIAAPSGLGDRTQDAAITTRVKTALVFEKHLPTNAFKITTERRIVYLQGIASASEVQAASNIIRGISGVNRVVLLIQPLPER